MFNQHKGANMQLLLQRAAAFRAVPGAVAAFLIPFTEFNIGREPNRTADPSVSNSPLKAPDTDGDATVDGTLTSILDLRSVGQWLYLMMGAPTVRKAVTKQPTNVTGVTVHHAHGTCPSGNGTLTYTAAGTLLTWTPQGGVAGAGVNVAAGGQFSIPGGAADQDVLVTVLAASLPVGNVNDADIAVSATLKAHSFPINMDDRPNALLECGHKDAGNNKFYRYLGSMVKSMSYDVTAREQNIQLELLAGEEVDPLPGAVWDAAPTSYVAARAAGAGGKITDGATGLGTVCEGTFKFSNAMEGKSIADGKEGYGVVDQGELGIGGTVKVVFASDGAYNKARANLSTRVLFQSEVAVGADKFRLVWDLPGVQFKERAVPKSGKSGLYADLEWSAHRLSNGQLPLCYLVNDVPAF